MIKCAKCKKAIASTEKEMLHLQLGIPFEGAFSTRQYLCTLCWGGVIDNYDFQNKIYNEFPMKIRNIQSGKIHYHGERTYTLCSMPYTDNMLYYNGNEPVNCIQCLAMKKRIEDISPKKG